MRCEALKTLRQLDWSQHLRRALHRKARVTKIADLSPGQPRASWRGQNMVQGREVHGYLADSCLGILLMLGSTHGSEQLRAAFGYED